MTTTSERRINEVKELLTEALSRLDDPNEASEAACWRLADALLMLGTEYPEACGVGIPTGRGAQIIHRPTMDANYKRKPSNERN